MGAARTQLCTSAFALLYSVDRLICRSLDSDPSGRNACGCREPPLQPESSHLPRPAVSSGLRAGCGCGTLSALLPSLLLFAPLQMFWCLDLTRVCVLVQGINSCSTCNFRGRAQEPVSHCYASDVTPTHWCLILYSTETGKQGFCLVIFTI